MGRWTPCSCRTMALNVGFLLVRVCPLLSAVGALHEETVDYFPEVKECNQPWEESTFVMSQPTSPEMEGEFLFSLDGKCLFPFRYKNGVFHDCVKFKAKHKWCSLNETYQGYWKYCSEEDFAKCIFPFWYRRMIYWECTDDAELSGKRWCSLTQNYNKDKVWKYCDL